LQHLGECFGEGAFLGVQTATETAGRIRVIKFQPTAAVATEIETALP
jgi:hypothetical protein